MATTTATLTLSSADLSSQALSITSTMTLNKAGTTEGLDQTTGLTKTLDSDYELNVFMTAEEVSQLIHSYVDSSFLQAHQNINELIIIIKSRVNAYYQYHTNSIDETTDIDSTDMKTIPFTWQVRDGGESLFDAQGTKTPVTSWPETIESSSSEITGVSGFVRSFSTTFIPGQPYVEFSMDFEQAMGSLFEDG